MSKRTPNKTKWRYGQSKGPTSWFETADILRDQQVAPRKPSKLIDRLDKLEGMLKDKNSGNS